MKKTEWFLVFVLIILVAFLLSQCRDNKMQSALYEATQDSLHISINKAGQQEATISILATANKNQFLKMNTKDTTIQKLQKVVKDYKGKIQAATVLGTSTAVTGSSVSTVTETDTVIKGSLIYIYPTYESQWDLRWSSGSIKATRDSIFRDFKVKNEFEITHGFERVGFFKPKELNVNILNLNPNTETLELRSYMVQIPNKRFTVGIHAGYGIVMNGVSIGTGPYIGVGVGFTVFKF